MISCIECGTEISIPADAVSGEIIDCPECGVELEVVDPARGEVRIAECEGEDWGE